MPFSFCLSVPAFAHVKLRHSTGQWCSTPWDVSERVSLWKIGSQKWEEAAGSLFTKSLDQRS